MVFIEMAVTIKLKDRLHPTEEMWLLKNIGRRLHYMHNSIGGEGWAARAKWDPGMVNNHWTLTLEDERMATWFLLHFPQ